MKNLGLKLLVPAAVIGVSAAVYSFTSDNDPDGPEFKKIEVIRMVDGEVTTYDTIVDAKAEYTAENYLADLGFEDDENVNIINLLDMHIPHMNMMMSGEDHEMEIEHADKMIFIEMDEEGVVKEEIHGDEDHEIVIEKRVIKSNVDGEEDVNIEIDVDGMLESINIDSIIASVMEMHGEGDSGEVVMHKMIVMDEVVEGPEGSNAPMEFHEMDVEGADYHKKMEGPGHQMEIAVWNDGDEAEDFTLVIVSDPSMGGENKRAIIANEKEVPSFKLFPNPSNSITNLQIAFEEKAPTSIMITDVKGNIVNQLDLGNFSGQFNHEINVEKWSKGVYMVHVEHGNEKIIEKLIVE